MHLLGSEILGYRLVELLGEGDLGSVWRAEHPKTGEFRAIKILTESRTGNQGTLERFAQEARALKGLSCSGLVQVEEFSTKHRAMVMEFVPGVPLSQKIGTQVGPMRIRLSASS